MLKNQKILITGVGKGIGREIFFEALKAEAYVIGVTRNQQDMKNLDQFKGKYKLFYGDVTKEATINKIFNYLMKNKIKLTGLVNNAGIRQRKKFEKITKKDFVKVLDNNLISPFLITQKFYINSDKKRNCSIINLNLFNQYNLHGIEMEDTTVGIKIQLVLVQMEKHASCL